jgi:hypothetical protein
MVSVWGSTVHMPPALAALHEDVAMTKARGMARVDRGTGLVARAIAWIIGFPQSATAVPLTVAIHREGGTETWVRRFASQEFTSRMTRDDGLVIEHFGPFAFAFALQPIAGGHAMKLQHWRCGSLPLPLALAPRITATETDIDGRFAFDVRIVLPLFGLLIAYRGNLVIAPKAVDPATWSLSDERRTARCRGR